MRKIPYGQINFETIINENLLYIDKTNYIEKLEADIDFRNVLETLTQKGDISAKIVNKFNLKMEITPCTILSMYSILGIVQ